MVAHLLFVLSLCILAHQSAYNTSVVYAYVSYEAAGAPDLAPQSASDSSVADAHVSDEVSGATDAQETSYETYVVAGPGQFLTSLAIGTPPVSFMAILDTGSDLTWRQCLPCELCYPQADKTIFNPSLSSSYSMVPCADATCAASYGTCGAGGRTTCNYDIVYIAPSAYTRGIVSTDALTMTGRWRPRDACLPAHIPGFVFGCSHSSKGPYNFAGAAGIAGFGRGTLSIPSQLNVTKFSYCLGSINDTTSRSPLVLGAGATLGHDSRDIQSTPLLSIDYGYVMELKGISVAGELLVISEAGLGLNISLYGGATENGGSSNGDLNGGGMIIDSGTTFTNLPTEAFHAVYHAFRARIPLPRSQLSPRNLTLCYKVDPGGHVPALSFYLKDATLHLPSHNIFIPIDGVFCLAFLRSHDGLSILGNVQQQNFHILYDLKASTISFKPADCHTLHLEAA